jgi:lactate dehydrogenase-like 2-hydroxyacid dehydrogenase
MQMQVASLNRAITRQRMTPGKSILNVMRPDASEAPPACGPAPVPDQIGIVGLGHMGAAMATNLAAAGHHVIAYVRQPDQLDKFARLGLTATNNFSSPSCCGTVITMLPDDAAIREVVLGGSGKALV